MIEMISEKEIAKGVKTKKTDEAGSLINRTDYYSHVSFLISQIIK